jgi:hypothetical protein
MDLGDWAGGGSEECGAGRPKIFLPVALGENTHTNTNTMHHFIPKLAGHQAVEDEVESAVEESHHIHDLPQGDVAVQQELGGRRLSPSRLGTWTPRQAESSPRMPWGNSVRRNRTRMTIRSRVVRSTFFWREAPAVRCDK